MAEFFISHMPLSITKLPLELLLEITRDVTFDDLRPSWSEYSTVEDCDELGRLGSHLVDGHQSSFMPHRRQLTFADSPN